MKCKYFYTCGETEFHENLLLKGGGRISNLGSGSGDRIGKVTVSVPGVQSVIVPVPG